MKKTGIDPEMMRRAIREARRNIEKSVIEVELKQLFDLRLAEVA